jgi:phosphoribosylformylglycinamidine cyclo-ligase
VHAVVRRGSWAVPTIFTELQHLGEVDDHEMAAVFNLGVGMVAVVPPADVDAALGALAAAGVGAGVIGDVVAGERGLTLV